MTAEDEVLFAPLQEPRELRVRGGIAPASSAPVARVLLESPLPHLARPFDYAVPAPMDAAAQPGVRVRVRFAGRLTSGFIVERSASTDHVGELAPLERVSSDLPVLTPAVLAMCEAVAARYAGTLPDVLRLAIPPRHATAEKSVLAQPATLDAAELRSAAGAVAAQVTEASAHAPAGEDDYLQALDDWLAAPDPTEVPGPRAAYALLPGDQPGTSWIRFGLRAAAPVLAAGRSVVWLVPDKRELAALEAQLRDLARFTVRLSADQGTSARWSAWVKALTGRAKLVIGTRTAAFAPVLDPGLFICFDDEDDSYLEQRAPYPHARQVLLERIRASGAAGLFLGYTRSVDVQRLVATGWLGEISVPREVRRAEAPLVLEPPPAREVGDLSRIPSRAFELMRGALGRTKQDVATGPVLVQVPRTGYIPVLACARCREVLRCPRCEHRIHAPSVQGPYACKNCGWHADAVRCTHCGSGRVRAVTTGLEGVHQDLGRAFPGVKVVRSGADRILQTVDDEPQIVVATTGAEPYAEGGYAAAILLDTLWPGPGLRSTDRAIARRLRAASLVRPARVGGRVLLMDEDPFVKRTVSRFEPVDWAASQLAERTQVHLPPSIRVAQLAGSRQAVGELRTRLQEQVDVRVLEERAGTGNAEPVGTGPAGAESAGARPAGPEYSVVVGFTIAAGPQVTFALAAEVAAASMRGDELVSVRVDDPDAL